jgi:hypothetical protein
MNKFYWFDQTNQYFDLDGEKKILSTAQFKEFFAKKLGKIPKCLSKLSQLEAACRELGIPGAKKRAHLKYHPEGYGTQKTNHAQKTRLIEIPEILRLKNEGKTDAEIARIAGVTRQNIFLLLRRKKTQAISAKTNQKA